METFTQPKITGYHQLGEQEAELMNEGKALAEQVGAYVAKLRKMPPVPPSAAPLDPVSGDPYIDQRWVSIGATELQKGFMALMRGIAKPSSF